MVTPASISSDATPGSIPVLEKKEASGRGIMAETGRLQRDGGWRKGTNGYEFNNSVS